MLIGIFYSQIVESSSLVSVLFREVFSHPYISFFHLLVNGFSVTCYMNVYLQICQKMGVSRHFTKSCIKFIRYLVVKPLCLFAIIYHKKIYSLLLR